MSSKILVPTDFTIAADKALSQAVNTAKRSGAEVLLAHICKSEKEVKAVREKLENRINEVCEGANVKPIVRIGDFMDIPLIASEEEVSLIFMASHGAKGLQKLVGSHILRIVNESAVPCIIVQKETSSTKAFDKILVTVSHNNESKQKIKAVADLAQLFKAEVIFICREETDENFKVNTATNLVFMKKELDKVGIPYSLEMSKGKNFNEDTVALAKKLEVGLISIMNMQVNTLLGDSILAPHYEQEMLMNEARIPVLIVNPAQNTVMGNAWAE